MDSGCHRPTGAYTGCCHLEEEERIQTNRLSFLFHDGSRLDRIRSDSFPAALAIAWRRIQLDGFILPCDGIRIRYNWTDQQRQMGQTSRSATRNSQEDCNHSWSRSSCRCIDCSSIRDTIPSSALTNRNIHTCSAKIFSSALSLFGSQRSGGLGDS